MSVVGETQEETRSVGDLLGAKLRPGNPCSAADALELICPLVERYQPWFTKSWLRGMQLLQAYGRWAVTCLSGSGLSPRAANPHAS